MDTGATAMTKSMVFLCPGQGAQSIGMGKSWCESGGAGADIFARADRTIELASVGASLSTLCFNGPAESLNRTDVCQPALYTCAVASFHSLQDEFDRPTVVALAGLSLGEYTALHLAGAFSFEDGLRLVAIRGRLMQEAAQASKGGMVALIGADEAQAQAVCDSAAPSGSGEVLVCANFNAPGQIVLSGHATACDRALELASTVGCRAAKLQVAGAFHSPLMAPAAESMRRALENVQFQPLKYRVWSNVTAQPHAANDAATLKKLLVDQIVCPVRWSESMSSLIAEFPAGDNCPAFHELAPGSVLKGLMRRIDKNCEIMSHDKPDKPNNHDTAPKSDDPRQLESPRS